MRSECEACCIAATVSTRGCPAGNSSGAFASEPPRPPPPRRNPPTSATAAQPTAGARPHRYASGDPVESWLHNLLCLDAATHLPQPPAKLPHPDGCELYCVERDTLFSFHKASEAFLQRVRGAFMACTCTCTCAWRTLLRAHDACTGCTPRHHLLCLRPQHTTHTRTCTCLTRSTLVTAHVCGCRSQVVALLVASHYKNTPNDLLLLADAPAHQLFVLLGPVDETQNALPDVLAVVQVRRA